MEFIVDDTGHLRYLGNLKPKAGLAYSWPIYGNVPHQPLVPRDRWVSLVPDEADNSHPFALLDNVHDQDGVGMCNASATAAALEMIRAIHGLPRVLLSGGDLYRRICGGSDRGSLLEDGIREAMAGGILPVSACPYMDWRTNYGKADVRAQYRVLEAYICPTFDHCFSAVLSGFALISGIMWYENYRTDAKGWLPMRGLGNPGGHAVMGYKPTRRGNDFGIWHKNSWTAGWGLNGTCVFPEPSYRGPVGGWWACRVVVDEGQDTPAPRN